MNKLVSVLAALAVAVLAAGCATTRAQTPAARMPALDVPPVPPRMIEPAPPLPVPQPEPVGELPTAPVTTSPKPKPQPRETQKPDAKPPDSAVVEQPSSAAVAPPTATVPPLRTARTADSGQTERKVKDILTRANGLLSKVDYRNLSAERKKAYDQAKQFIEGAEAAIRDGKVEYALELADKAETFAKQLQG
jgi:outer membrane biosynthesis protein TonB